MSDHPPARPVHWQQHDIIYEHPGAAARLIASFATWTPAALEQGEVSGLFFMQKPPGLRLRIADATHDVRSRLTMPGLTITRGQYTPEIWLFDGPAGMAHAHQAFTADSLAISAWTAAALSLHAVSDARDFSRLLCEQLLINVGLDAFERWDVWMRVHVLRGGDWRAIRPAGTPHNRPARAADLPILRTYAERMASINLPATDFPSGLRAILPFWIIFHWNRIGLSLSAQRDEAAYQAGACHPCRAVEAASLAWATLLGTALAEAR